MIFHQDKCIYIHVPKSGGTSVMKAFGLNWSHADSRRMNHAHDDLSALPTYFRFATIRNPFDRFISGWQQCDFTKNRTVLDVLTNLPAKQAVTEVDDAATEDFAYHHITVTQRNRLFGLDGLLAVNFLVRFESLQADFDRLCDMIGKPRCLLPHENAGTRAPYQHYFDREPEARMIAERCFQEDLESFGYRY